MAVSALATLHESFVREIQVEVLKQKFKCGFCGCYLELHIAKRGLKKGFA